MYLRELELTNFRIFSEGNGKGRIRLPKGVAAIVGGNDHGKTAVIDAIRLLLGTSDLDYARISVSDFHTSITGETVTEFRIRAWFDDLSNQERGTFAEYLSYEKLDDGNVQAVLYLNLIAKNHKNYRRGRPFISTEVRSGADSDGPVLDQNTRALLVATYLRPLRDAEREMSAGRGSRLSQILLNTETVGASGEEDYVRGTEPADVKKLSVLHLGDYSNDLLSGHDAIQGAGKKLNSEYLEPLSFGGDMNSSQISIGVGGDDKARLRQILEKLELQLIGDVTGGVVRHGLGSNNLLYMACELLLLGDGDDGTSLLLIEEPEAHLHPQRQLLLMQFLKDHAEKHKADLQIILTTHSPNLASVLPLGSLILMQKGKAFSLADGQTKLAEGDYRFLERFLDVTKANLFFARGVLIVEGDAENILLPTLARLIGRDLTKHGVSVVNVGGVGLGRFARIFMREDEAYGQIGIPVACITDLDVMPDCAPEILGIKKVQNGEGNEEWPTNRRWLMVSDFPKDGKTVDAFRQDKIDKVSGQSVSTFVADHWTLEYDLAKSELAEEVYVAAKLAQADEKICDGTKIRDEVERVARDSFAALPKDQERPSKIYAEFAHKTKITASKAIAAQYLTELLEAKQGEEWSKAKWETVLPSYLVEAIKHVTPNAGVLGIQPQDGDRDAGGEIPEQHIP